MVGFMENLQFHVDKNKFNCVECGKLIKIPKKLVESIINDPEERSLPLTCDSCGTEYEVAVDPEEAGLLVTAETASESESLEEEEIDFEDGEEE